MVRKGKGVMRRSGGKKGERGKEEEWRKERGGGVEVRKGKGVRWKSGG